jgi:hypothetical protein
MLVAVFVAGDAPNLMDHGSGSQQIPVVPGIVVEHTHPFHAVIKLNRKAGHATGELYVRIKELRPCLQPG